MKKNNLQKIFWAVLIPFFILTIWELGVRNDIVPNSIIATPTAALAKLLKMLCEWSFWLNVFVSIKRLILGFFIGSFIGIWIGILVGYSKFIARLLEPTILVLIPVPPMAWIPFLILFFGYDDISKIALISIGSFCTLFLSTSFAVRATDKNLLELGVIYKKTSQEILKKIVIPSALPNILSSMRVAMALSWTLLLGSEIINSSSGLGWLIADARNFSRPDDMLVGMIVIGFLGKSTDKILLKINDYLTKWQRTLKDF